VQGMFWTVLCEGLYDKRSGWSNPTEGGGVHSYWKRRITALDLSQIPIIIMYVGSVLVPCSELIVPL
jgi:hypothetical protein